jgi:hypothetical protein
MRAFHICSWVAVVEWIGLTRALPRIAQIFGELISSAKKSVTVRGVPRPGRAGGLHNNEVGRALRVLEGDA